MIIRHAQAHEYSALAKIHIDSWQKNYRQELTPHYLNEIAPSERLSIWQQRLQSPQKNQRVFVAESNNAIIGFACVFLDEHPTWGAYLDNLHVVAPFQAQGVGSALLNKVLRLCRQQPVTQGLCLLVNQSNHRAQKFYLTHGARNIQTSEWHAPDGSLVPTFWFTWGQ